MTTWRHTYLNLVHFTLIKKALVSSQSLGISTIFCLLVMKRKIYGFQYIQSSRSNISLLSSNLAFGEVELTSTVTLTVVSS